MHADGQGDVLAAGWGVEPFAALRRAQDVSAPQSCIGDGGCGQLELRANVREGDAGEAESRRPARTAPGRC